MRHVATAGSADTLPSTCRERDSLDRARVNGWSNSHSLNGSTPSTLPAGDFDKISTRNEHFASLAVVRSPC